jgi:hypothetical protein
MFRGQEMASVMSVSTGPHLADKPSLTDAQASRVLALKRAYQRELGRKPTLIQTTLINRACMLTAKAEAAALDPSVTANDLVRLDNKAQQARAEMFESFRERRTQPNGASLDDYLVRRGAA